MLALETVVKIRGDHFRDKVPIEAIVQKREHPEHGAENSPGGIGGV